MSASNKDFAERSYTRPRLQQSVADGDQVVFDDSYDGDEYYNRESGVAPYVPERLLVSSNSESDLKDARPYKSGESRYESAASGDHERKAVDLEQPQIEQEIQTARAHSAAVSMQAKHEARSKKSMPGRISRESKRADRAEDVKVHQASSILEGPRSGASPRSPIFGATSSSKGTGKRPVYRRDETTRSRNPYAQGYNQSRDARYLMSTGRWKSLKERPAEPKSFQSLNDDQAEDVREYRVQAFTLPGRGSTLFMLKAESAHVLDIHEIDLDHYMYPLLEMHLASEAEVATLREKNIHFTRDIYGDVLVVTARSVYKQFGDKIVKNGVNDVKKGIIDHGEMRKSHWRSGTGRDAEIKTETTRTQRVPADLDRVMWDLEEEAAVNYMRRDSTRPDYDVLTTPTVGYFSALRPQRDASTIERWRRIDSILGPDPIKTSAMPHRTTVAKKLPNPSVEDHDELSARTSESFNWLDGVGNWENTSSTPSALNPLAPICLPVEHVSDTLASRFSAVQNPSKITANISASVNHRQQRAPQEKTRQLQQQAASTYTARLIRRQNSWPQLHISLPRSVQENTVFRTIRVTIEDRNTEVNISSNYKYAWVRFSIDWNLKSFMQEQYGSCNSRQLSTTIVTVCDASSSCTRATTVENYLSAMWPLTYSGILMALEGYLDGSLAAVGYTIPEIQDTDNGINVKFPSSSIVHVVQYAQLLAWLASALRFSDNESIQKVVPSLQPIYTAPLDGPISFTLSFTQSPLVEDSHDCWRPLFHRMVVVDDLYWKDTTPEAESRGLEIPFSMMTRLGGANQIVDYGGGVIVKGFSAAFVPIVVTTDSIQWHYTYNEDDSRLSYNDVITRCPKRVMVEACSVSAAKSKKCFLGWVGNAVHKLGTDLARYNRIDYSQTKEPPRPLNFHGGSFGFQNIGTGELSFSPGLRDGRLHVHREGPYKRILKHASSTPVTLYDTDEQRAWLVPASAVIAHIIQKRLHMEKESDEHRVVKVVATVPTADMARGAEDMLLANADVVLSEDEQDYGKYRFRDMVSTIWSLLEALLDKNVHRQNTSSPYVRVSLHSHLTGWEFMDVVMESSPVRLKEVQIPRDNGGWKGLVEGIDAIVFLAAKFGNLIKPTKEAQGNMCEQWKHVPMKKHYLTTTVSMLKACYETAGSKDSRKYLTNTDLEWHSDGALFDRCHFSKRSLCGCDRTQQIFKDSMLSFTQIIPPGPLEERGAVIFGHKCGKPVRSRRDTQREGRHFIHSMYRHPNIPLTSSTISCSVDVASTVPKPPQSTESAEPISICNSAKAITEIVEHKEVDIYPSLPEASFSRADTIAHRPSMVHQ